MIIKRLLGNIIDFLVYIIVFFILFKMSGLETDTNHLYYFYFISFVFTFLLPIILINNTIGKQLLKLKWKNSQDLKLKLGLKYTFYYLSVAPSFSILSAISSFPLLNPAFGNFDKILSFKILIVYTITDLIVFILSFGKFHIIDYLFKLDLDGYSFYKKPIKFLYITYLFFGLLIISNLYSYKYDLTFSSIENSIIQS